MSDNVLQTLQKLVQDVIAPDVRETKVRLESLAKETDTRFKSVDARFDSVDKQFESVAKQIESLAKENNIRFEALEKNILSAITASRAQSELTSSGEISALRERVAVLESHLNRAA